jgi:hypothetical protein
MGKVGSSSLENSIQDAIHLHSMDGLSNKYFLNNYTERLKPLDFFQEKVTWRLIQRTVRHKINQGENIKVITLVREPISRNVSAFFQPIKVRNSLYSESYFYLYCNHFTPLYWFQYEIEKHLNIDIYKHPFDQKKGYSIIKQNNVELLLLKLEKITSNLEVLGEFLEVNDFELKDANVAEDKWYADIYNDFKKSFSPKSDYIDVLYNSTFMKHFYSEEEIETFRMKWLSKKSTKS